MDWDVPVPVASPLIPKMSMPLSRPMSLGTGHGDLVAACPVYARISAIK
jgi:hypothetical protein